MPYNRTYYRDRIVIDAGFARRLKLETVSKGSTILIAGREVSVQGAIELNDYHLVLLADRITGAGGRISVRATEAVAENTPGRHGPSVTVICRRIAGLAITSTGGPGGAGLRGAPGARGRPGRPGWNGSSPVVPAGAAAKAAGAAMARRVAMAEKLP